MPDLPILYIKNGCPWCEEALAYFVKHGVALNVKDVRVDGQAMEHLVSASGQTRTPTLHWGDFVVADFSVGEFEDALEKTPGMREKLGMGG